jgi:hypothetical protein
MKKSKKKFKILPFLYLFAGIYFLNFGLNYLVVPEVVSGANKWILAAGGLLFFVAFYRSIMYSQKRILRRAVKSAK